MSANHNRVVWGYRQKFLARLADVPRSVRLSMLETVRSGADIAYNSWVVENENGEPCGCLLMDGMAKRDPELFKLWAGRFDENGGELRFGDEKDLILDLTEFYGVGHHNDNTLMLAAHAWDHWIGEADPEDGETIHADATLTQVGRRLTEDALIESLETA